MRTVLVFVPALVAVLLLHAPIARADLPEANQAADAAIAAFDAGDRDALTKLAASGRGGTWLTADVLVGRERLDVAKTYAEASPALERKALLRYVEGPARTPETKAARVRHVQIHALMNGGKLDEAKAQLKEVPQAPPSVPSYAIEYLRAAFLRSEKQVEAALDALRRSAEIAETVGNGQHAMIAHFRAARWAQDAQAYPRAEASYRHVVRIARTRGPSAERILAEMLGRLAMIVDTRGAYREGLAINLEALALHRKQGHRQWEAAILSNCGVQQILLGELTDAIRNLEAAHALQLEIGDAPNAAITLGTLASAHEELGDLDLALKLHARSLEAKRKLDLHATAARTLSSMAIIHWRRGAYDRYFARMDEALALNRKLDDKHGTGFVLGRLGQAYVELRDYERAATLLGEAREILEGIGAADQLVHVWSALADLHGARKDYDAAIALHEDVIAQHEKNQSTAELCGSIQALSTTLGNAGRHEDALREGRRALALAVGLEEASIAAYAHLSVASAHASLGHYEKAMEHVATAREKAGDHVEERFRIALDDTVIDAAHRAGKHAKAVDAALDAARAMQGRYRRLADEERAGARARWARGIAQGVISAARLGRAEDAYRLIEWNRASALREALGGARDLHAALLSPELRHAEAEARLQEAAAVRRLRSAEGRRTSLKRRRALRKDLKAARDRVEEVARRIQREAAGAADLTAEAPPALGTLQGDLGPDEAFVHFATAGAAAVAVVTTAKEARCVDLGESTALRALCAALLTDRDGTIDEDARKRLVAALIDPLRLPAATRRVRIAPDGPLGYVPFALLLPRQEIVFTPSAATDALLTARAPTAAARVLALGNPVYSGKGSAQARGAARAGFSLSPLPATKAEAEAIGDVVLTGSEATEANLRVTLAQHERWRAVHLACHGLVDAERPAFCSLALTPDEEDDGFLTALEIMRMRVPAEIVVLSACETGRGRVVAGEGILGLTRAFMLAGSSRVLVSLWRVDDRATRILMERFYALWKKDGLTPAAALKAAQAHVRDLEERVLDREASRKAKRPVHVRRKPYADPRYWAGWVLWGRA